nr:hypothetical protein [Marinicella sp. W31]MDC2877530.1 hypothetical protein [Marinicella sp. W31]
MKKRSMIMSSSGHRRISVVLVMASLVVGASLRPVCAFDIATEVPKDSGRFDLFRFGFKAYERGDKEKAVEAYRYAAEKGHTGSRWALANMYAYGDGVPENDYEAFKFYAEIVNHDVEPGSPDTGFYVNALLALAGYYQTGIPDTPVEKDLAQARQFYFQAASVFGSPEGQFRLAEMILDGQGGAKNVRLAKNGSTLPEETAILVPWRCSAILFSMRGSLFLGLPI